MRSAGRLAVTALIGRFARSETASAAIEYALAGTLISIAIIVGAVALGSQLDIMFQGIAGKVLGP
jgi:pilus assembly protein Flp/PilA